LNRVFSEVAHTAAENKYYVVAPEFNLTIPPDVLTVAAHDLAEGLRPFMQGNEVVYGIPVAGDRVSTPVSERLWLRSSVARKGIGVPGSWTDVMSLTTHSYTTHEERVQLHFGFVNPGMRVFLLDDVIATGETIVDTIEAFRIRNVEVAGVGVMFAKAFERGLQRVVEEFGVPTICPVVIEDISDDRRFTLAQFQH
jgi:adenine phosphoribosyltransferase